MNETMIDSIAIRTLLDLIDDAREENSPLNDDDFADAAEIALIDDHTSYTDDDLTTIARRMIFICDKFNTAH